jgi:TorA maturation chaperone TorD
MTAAAEPEVAAALLRAGIYRLLGLALGPPAPARLAEVIRLAHAGAAAGVPGGLRAGLERLAAAARDAEPGALAEEYVYLFDREARCPAYESAWGDAAQLAGKAAALADIAGFYAAFGLGPSAGQPDLEDHVGAELEFMSALAVREAYALAEGHDRGREVTRDAARAFLTDHLGRWTPAFAAGLRAATRLPFYGAVADLLAGWVEHDAAGLGARPVLVAARTERDPIQEEESFTCPLVPPEA